MTDQSLELFRCEPLSARLSRKACAGNYKIAQHKGQPTRGGTHPQGRARCLGCEIGAAHARGELIPVERITWTKPTPKTESERPRVAQPLVEAIDRPETSHHPVATPSMPEPAPIVESSSAAPKRTRATPLGPRAHTAQRALAPASPPTPPETTPETAPAPVPEAPTMLSSSTFADVFRACVQEPAHSDEVFRLPHELLDLVAGLDAPASIARVIDCAYMAGMTKGTTESRAWLERATRYARRSA